MTTSHKLAVGQTVREAHMQKQIGELPPGVLCRALVPFGDFQAGDLLRTTDAPCPWPKRRVVEYDMPHPDHELWQTGLTSVGDSVLVAAVDEGLEGE